MRSLARYAVTNAVTRTMLSELIASDELEEILRAGTSQETWSALRKTAYGSWIMQDVPTDVLAIEKTLREVSAVRFKRSIRSLKGEPLDVGNLLLSRWDLDNLEFALRLWHGKDPGLEKYLTHPCFACDIPVFDITRSETIDEIALALRHTPYFESVSSSVKKYKESQSVFYVELALEKDYYYRLLQAVHRLGGSDAYEGTRIIAAEIDMLNLAWLRRLIQYYEIESSECADMLIPAPSDVYRHLTAPDFSVESLDGLGAQFVREGSGTLSGLERASALEHMVGEMAVDAARRLLAGYPFSITCVLAFYLLKRIELKNLCVVFSGKAAEVEVNEIAQRLSGVR